MDDARPLDTVPIAEIVDRVLARHPGAREAQRRADHIAATADEICSRFAARGRLLLTATDATTTAGAEVICDRFSHDYGFADGAVLVTAPGDARPTLRDVVIGVEDLAGARAEDVTAALDALAVAVAATLGHLHGELPVDLVPQDDEDRDRVVAMVAEIAQVDGATARAAAVAAGHDTRVAVLALVGGLSLGEATLLAANRRTLRDALTNLPRRPPERSGGG